MAVEVIHAEEALKVGYSADQIMRSTYIRTRIYGGYYIEKAMSYQTKLKHGEEVLLKSDGGNEKDCFAIKVYNRHGKELGFIKKELASAIINIRDYDCKVIKPVTPDELVGSTKKSFGVEVLITYFWT